MECIECILQIGADQFVVPMESVLKTFGSKIAIFLDTTSRTDTYRKYVIRRPKNSTMALIEYCYTGQLHIPQSICKGEFLTELQFWGLKPNLLETCCYHKLCAFVNDKKMLKGFEDMHTKPENNDAGRNMNAKERIWSVVNCDRKSKCSKVYFYVSTTFVLLMITILALTSMKDVHDTVQKDMSASAMNMTRAAISDMLPRVSPTTDTDHSGKTTDCKTTTPQPLVFTYTPMIIKVDCDYCSVLSSGSPGLSPTRRRTEYKVQNTYVYLHIPKCCHPYVKQSLVMPEAKMVEPPVDYNDYDDTINPEADRSPTNSSSVIPQNFTRDDSINTRILTTIKETILTSKEKLSSFRFALKLNNVAQVEYIVCHYMEHVITAFFTVEFVLRLITCPNKKEFLSGVLNWLDVILLLGSFGRILLDLRSNLMETLTVLYDLLLYLQMFRVFRLFRTIEHIKAFKVLRYSLVTGMKDICVLVMYVMVSMCIFSNFIYFVEKKSDFPSIPAAWWWSIVTMTTVGYGDMVPKTALGKLIGCMCALSGVVLFSLIIPVFVSTFLTAYEYANGSLDEEDGKTEPGQNVSPNMNKDKPIEKLRCVEVVSSKHQGKRNCW